MGERGRVRGEFQIFLVNAVSLKLLYNDNKGCHSRENGNPAEKTGSPRIKYPVSRTGQAKAGSIKSGMTFSVKSFLIQYNRDFFVKMEKKAWRLHH